MQNGQKLPIILDIPEEILKELPKRHIIGGGKNSIVYLNGSGDEGIIKKYYNNKDKIITSSKFQERIQKILCDYPVRVPDIYYIDNKKAIICMEHIHSHPNFDTNLIHTIFGYSLEHLDLLWYIPGTYITRGFYASSETINSLAKKNNWYLSNDTNIVFIMGSILRRLIDEHILPYGIEWIIDRTGRIWLIDFDECEEGVIDPTTFFYSSDLEYNIYTPKFGSNLYKSFYHGYFGHDIDIMSDIDELYFSGRTTNEFSIELDDEIDIKIKTFAQSISLIEDDNIYK